MSILEFLGSELKKANEKNEASAEKEKAARRKEAVKSYIAFSFNQKSKRVSSKSPSTQKDLARQIARNGALNVSLVSFAEPQNKCDVLRHIFQIGAKAIDISEIEPSDILDNEGYQTFRDALSEEGFDVTRIEMQVDIGQSGRKYLSANVNVQPRLAAA